MNKWFLSGLCMVMPLIVFGGVIDHTIVIHERDIATEKLFDYDYVSLKGYDHIIESGYPALPVQYLSFVIPADAKFERLEIASEQGIYLPGMYVVFPAQKPAPTSEPRTVEFTLPDDAIYSLNELYPSAAVQYMHEGSLSGYRVVSVCFTPLRYNPTTKQLYLVRHITLRIHYRSGALPPKRLSVAQNSSAQQRVRAIVVNKEQVDVFAPPSFSGQGVWKSEYIIITDSSFVNKFARLRDWKTRKGVPAEIVTTSWIYSNYLGMDKPDKIRSFIKAAADSGALYFLLAGQCDWEVNEEYVPRRDAYCYRCYQGGWPDEDTIPCDMYYADLDGTWDANGNGIYGELADSVDLYSNVFVGRAPVKNSTQAEYFVDKVIAYETAPALDYVKKVLLANGNLFAYNHGTGMSDTIADAIPDTWQKTKIYEDYGLMSRYVVRDSINQAFHLSNMNGHGNQRLVTYAYGAKKYYCYCDPEKDPATQTNDVGEGIIVTSNSCATGAVDKGYWATDNDCLAERMIITNKACAVATLMNTRYGWSNNYREGSYDYTDRIIVWFYRMLFGSNAYHLGEVLATTKDYLVPNAEKDALFRWCVYTFNLFGDPEMPIWTDRPDTLLVTHAPIVYTGTTTFGVNVKDGTGVPLPNALVCCWIPRQTPEEYKVQYTDASGNASFSLAPKNHGDTMYVTASKHNYIPHQGFARVHKSGPYIASGKLVVNEPDGDGKVNNGETINLGVWAKNWGNQVASAVVGNLSESDPYVTVTVSNSKYGSKINANDSVLSSPYYRFTVANNCPNRHPIMFNLEFRDRRDTVWTSYPRLTVYAPVVTFQSVSVANDNNHDGYLAPSERANLVITLKNQGDATAKNVLTRLSCVSPYVVLNDSLAYFGNINPGMTATNSVDPLTITLASNTPYKTVLDFSLFVIAGAYSTTLNFAITVMPPDLYPVGTRVVNDDDGYLEMGETAGLVVTITNMGKATADNVTSVLRSSSPYINLIDSTGGYGSVPANDTVDNAGDVYVVAVDSATPPFTQIVFSIITYSRTYIDTLTVSQTVYVPVITIKDIHVMNDNDGDGILEPGETAELYAVLGNDGVVASDSATMILRTTSPHIMILDSVGTLVPIASKATGDNAGDPFRVSADSATPYFSQANCSIFLEAGLCEDTLVFGLNTGQWPPSDTGYYWAYYSSGPHVQSPVFEWSAIDTTQTQYQGIRLLLGNDETAQITLPFTFTYYGLDYTQISVCSNGWVAMGGTSACTRDNMPIPGKGPSNMIAGVWDDLHPCFPWPPPGQPSKIFYYFDEARHRFIVEYFMIVHYPFRTPGQYETFEIILHDPAYYPTPTGDGEIIVQYLTRMHQNRADSIWGPDCDAWDNTVGIENDTKTLGIQYYYNGAYHSLADIVTDSFAIKYTTLPKGAYPKYPCASTLVKNGTEQSNNKPLDNMPTQTLLNSLYPNPFVTGARIHYQLAEASTVILQVYDAAGRLVLTFVDGARDPGYYSFFWNGCDEIGRKVPAGVYFIRLETDDYQKTEKAVLLR